MNVFFFFLHQTDVCLNKALAAIKENLVATAYSDILDNGVLITLWQEGPFLVST